jgi:hypothetical protein
MTNIAPSPFSTLSPKQQEIAWKCWLPTIAPSNITHFLTVSFCPPLPDVDPEVWNKSTSSHWHDIVEPIVRRFDKRLYGKSHSKIPDEEKFPFLFLIETRNKNRLPTFAHVHGAISFRDTELNKLEDRWPQIEMDIAKLVRTRNLVPDIRLDKANDDIVDYLGKNARFQADLINTRATINKAATELVSP